MSEQRKDQSGKPRWLLQFTLRQLLVATAVISCVIGVAKYLLDAISEAAHRDDVIRAFHSVALAIANYDSSRKRLPPANRTDEVGSPISSWRFQILPYIESTHLARDVHDPWDARSNALWARKAHPTFCFSEKRASNEISCRTNVVAVTGPGTAFDPDAARKLSDLDSDTILVVETRNSGIHWMEPGDFDVETMPRSINHLSGRGVSGTCAGGFHVAFADGAAWFLSESIPFEDLRKFFLVQEAKLYDRDEVLRPYLIDELAIPGTQY